MATVTGTVETDPDPTGDEPGVDPTVVTGDPSKEDPAPGGDKSYSQSDVDSIARKIEARVREEAKAESSAAIEKAEQEAERQRLIEDGKHKELAENVQAENEVLKAEMRQKQFKEDSRAVLDEHGLGEFQEVLLEDVSTVEGVKARGDKLKAIVDAHVESAVNERLGTGTVPRDKGTPIPTTLLPSKMSQEQKLKFIKEHGQEGYEELIEAEREAGTLTP